MKKYLILALLAFVSANVSAASLFSDNFNTYADGSLTTVSGGIWANHSGTALQVDVQSGAVNLTATESEDVNAQITGGPYTSRISKTRRPPVSAPGCSPPRMARRPAFIVWALTTGQRRSAQRFRPTCPWAAPTRRWCVMTLVWSQRRSG